MLCSIDLCHVFVCIDTTFTFYIKLVVSFRDRITNEEVRIRVRAAAGPHDDLSIVKTRKLRWYGHVTRS